MKSLQFDLKKALFNKRLGVSEHRQFQILETALELIQKEGFEQLQFGDLAKKCKVSRSLVHHYFKDKMELANRLLDLSTLHLQHEVQSALSREKKTERHFEVYCKATLDWAAEHSLEATGLLLFINLSSHNIEMRQRNDELSALGRQRIKLLLTQAGMAGPSLDSNAQVIQVLLTGCYLVLLSENHNAKESLQLRKDCLKTCLSIGVSK
ncbi:TetR/AcrR family transcriptional regulator [Bdellovibrio sp. KM01]|uniref:TetR/AcrR family transcriptional regulator n=1 Tax=Bdellovibrio sp. KM01 TaxID=2748865 RepID=UPI0015EA17B0|nr:TetR/AcrR family transcriptional regulator [Bdellovibrio sp. KM01]QLY26477.1 TetR/AcrR family transcriptional regulator [Bdellovibrio sp. KM01]